MHPRLVACLMLASCSGCGEDESDAAARGVVVVDVHGHPRVNGAPVAAGRPVGRGSTLEAPAGSGVLLGVGASVRIAVDGSSRAKAESVRTGPFAVELVQGALRVRTEGRSSAEVVVVRAAGRRIEIRAGVVRVVVGSGAIERVSVLDGEATVLGRPADRVVVAAPGTWSPVGGTSPIDEEDARRLAALVAGRPWIARRGSS